MRYWAIDSNMCRLQVNIEFFHIYFLILLHGNLFRKVFIKFKILGVIMRIAASTWFDQRRSSRKYVTGINDCFFGFWCFIRTLSSTSFSELACYRNAKFWYFLLLGEIFFQFSFNINSNFSYLILWNIRSYSMKYEKLFKYNHSLMI